MNYLRLRAKPARQLLEEVPEVVAFRAEGIGYLGAVGDDQARWSSGFRRLLDALGGPLQVVLRFRPRDSDGVIALRREVVLATGSAAGPTLRTALIGLGLTVTEEPLPDASHTFGEQLARSFRDRFGWHRTWYIDSFPGGELEPGWLLRLIPSGLEVDLAWHAEPVGSGWAAEYLQRQLAHLRASQLDGERRGIPDVRIGAAVPAAVDLQRKLSAGQERAFHLATYLTLTAPDRERLESGAAHVIDAARSALCELREATLRQFEGRLATLPLGIDRLRRRHLVDTSAVITLLPWLDVEVADPGGLRLGRSRATLRPVVVDPFSDRHHENANVAVFGHSGAGKTYLLKTLALAATRAGCQVFVMIPSTSTDRSRPRSGGQTSSSPSAVVMP